MLSKSHKLNTKGLTIVECAISILVLAVMLAGGLILYSNAEKIVSLAMQKKMALEIAVQEMENIKNTGYAVPLTNNLWEDLPDKTFDLFQTKLCKKITELDSAIAPKMKKVELKVVWAKNGKLAASCSAAVDSPNFVLETLVSPP